MKELLEFRNILENLYEGVYCVDSERKIIFWNKGAERITGYSAEEVLGRSCADNILVMWTMKAETSVFRAAL